MKVWKVVFYVLIFFLAIYGVYVTFLNYDNLRTPFYLTNSRTTTVGVFILCAFLAGFVLMGFRFLVESWKRDRENRKHRKVLRHHENTHDSLALFLWPGLQSNPTAIPPSLTRIKGPDHPLLALARAATLQKGEGRDVVITRMKDLVSTYPDSSALKLILIQELLADERITEAESVLAELAGGSRETPHLLLARRHIAMARENWSECISIQKKIVGSGETTEEDRRLIICYRYEQAKAMVKEGQPKPALTILRSLQRDHPNFVPAWVLTGDLHLKEGDGDKAVATWKEGFSKSKAIIFLERISDHFLNAVNAEGAIETISEIAYGTDKDIIPRFFLGRLYYRLEMHAEAMREFNLIRPKVSRSPTLNYLIGVLHEKTGKPADAASSFRRALTEIGTLKNEYCCLSCKALSRSWQDRCPNCGSWNSVELDYPIEKTQPRDLGIDPFPIRFPTS